MKRVSSVCSFASISLRVHRAPLMMFRPRILPGEVLKMQFFIRSSQDLHTRHFFHYFLPQTVRFESLVSGLLLSRNDAAIRSTKIYIHHSLSLFVSGNFISERFPVSYIYLGCYLSPWEISIFQLYYTGNGLIPEI